MKEIESFFKRDRFAGLSGIELISVAQGKAKARVRLEDCHLNGIDTAHGGLIFTLADFAFAVAVNSHGPVAVSIEASVSYLRPVSRGIITAEAAEISRTNKLSICMVDVFDQSGDKIAVFKGTAYLKNVSLDKAVD